MSQAGDRSLDFRGGGLGIGRGQRGESREMVRVAAHPSAPLACRARDGQDLRVHAAGVYAGQAFRADVEQAAGWPPLGCSSC